MERKLLLLGLLRAQDMHGYQLSEVIDSHLGMSLQLKKATAYDLLKKMEADGWITYYEEREGNRPVRRVYSITPAGEAAFQSMLRESVAAYPPAEFASEIGLAFLDALPPAEALLLLRQRQAAIQAALDSVTGVQPHPGSMQLVVDHRIHHLTAELAWIAGVITRLETHEGDESV